MIEEPHKNRELSGGPTQLCKKPKAKKTGSEIEKVSEESDRNLKEQINMNSHIS